jgi:hypothetical protein
MGSLAIASIHDVSKMCKRRVSIPEIDKIAKTEAVQNTKSSPVHADCKACKNKKQKIID